LILQSAVQSLTVVDNEIYPDAVSKIGVLMYELITLHPFVEGNKRTGFMCADTLLVLNDRILVASGNERIAISLKVVRLEIDRDFLVEWLWDHSIESANIRTNNHGTYMTTKTLKRTLNSIFLTECGSKGRHS